MTSKRHFDSVDRSIIWRLMKHYGFPSKFISLIQQLYNNSSCQVIQDGKLTATFQIQTGVRQGCLPLPTIFLLVVDWLMKQATSDKTGSGLSPNSWRTWIFADDISLLSHRHYDMQEKLFHLAKEAEKTGLNINTKKTVVDKDGGTDEDVKSRINNPRHAFNMLHPIWNSSTLSLYNKIRIFNTNIKSVQLYGSETWRPTK